MRDVVVEPTVGEVAGMKNVKTVSGALLAMPFFLSFAFLLVIFVSGGMSNLGVLVFFLSVPVAAWGIFGGWNMEQGDLVLIGDNRKLTGEGWLVPVVWPWTRGIKISRGFPTFIQIQKGPYVQLRVRDERLLPEGQEPSVAINLWHAWRFAQEGQNWKSVAELARLYGGIWFQHNLQDELAKEYTLATMDSRLEDTLPLSEDNPAGRVLHMLVADKVQVFRNQLREARILEAVLEVYKDARQTPLAADFLRRWAAEFGVEVIGFDA